MDNRKDSLEFLQECIDKVENATPEMIENYKKSYNDLHMMCSTFFVSDTPGTEMKIGNIVIYIKKHFNKFQKKMLKWCFGFDEINDIVR